MKNIDQNPGEAVEAAAPAGTLSRLDQAGIVLFSLLLFLAMTIQTGRMTMLLILLALVLSIGKTPLRNLRAHLCVPVLGLSAFVLMNGLAAIYSSFGAYAVREFYKIMAAFALGVILLTRFQKKHVPGLLWGLSAVCGAISLLCVDLGSSQVVFLPFSRFAHLLNMDFSTILDNAASGRFQGIYNDANLSGGLLALGGLVSLCLVQREEKFWKKALACLLLGMSMVGFLTAMSRGAILCFGLAALTYLLAAGKDGRTGLFFLMVETAIVAAPAAFLAMRGVNTDSLLPDAVCVLSGLVIFLLDWVVGSRLARRLRGHGKVFLALAGVLVACAAAFVAVALRATEPLPLPSDSILRSAKLPQGTYTLTADADGGDLRLRVYSMTDEQQMKGENTILYYGSMEDVSFTVENADCTVYFAFGGSEEGVLRGMTISNGTEVPMKYKFLPEMVAHRLHEGLFSSRSYLLRVQYMKDAWTLFLKSPLIGHGLGSTEGLYTSVQPLYYESLYVHNHILQVMSDMGLLGLAAFLTLLLGVVWLLLRNLRGEDGSLAAMLLACWVMMNAHGLMEIDFSVRAFQCVAFMLLLSAVLLFGKPLAEKHIKAAGWAVAACIWALLGVFGGLLESHRMVERETNAFASESVHELMKTCKSLVSRDVFDHEQLQLTYIAYGVQLNDSDYNGTVRKYAEELRRSGTYPACTGVAEMYYLPKGNLTEMFAASREGIAQEASTNEAWNYQFDMYRDAALPAITADQADTFVDGVLETKAYLEEYSQGRMEEIELTEENQAFLDAVASARDAGLSGEGLYVYLTQVLSVSEPAGETPAE